MIKVWLRDEGTCERCIADIPSVKVDKKAEDYPRSQLYALVDTLDQLLDLVADEVATFYRINENEYVMYLGTEITF